MKIIARIHTDFPEKFGIPRQSGLVEEAVGRIVFEPAYRDPEALRGLDGYSHIWLLWEFSEAKRDTWSPTVRPPRLGGNKRMGVFATRSPFRPNPIGLSCVRLERIEETETEGNVLIVRGADLLDGTPIYDVKPYLPYTDSRPDAVGGFADEVRDYALTVEFPDALAAKLTPDEVAAVSALLAEDPRPSYQNDPERVYYLTYGKREIAFTVEEQTLRVKNVT